VVLEREAGEDQLVRSREKWRSIAQWGGKKYPT